MSVWTTVSRSAAARSASRWRPPALLLSTEGLQAIARTEQEG